MAKNFTYINKNKLNIYDNKYIKINFLIKYTLKKYFLDLKIFWKIINFIWKIYLTTILIIFFFFQIRKLATPVDWKAGDKAIIVPSVSKEEADKTFSSYTTEKLPSGKEYLRFT